MLREHPSQERGGQYSKQEGNRSGRIYYCRRPRATDSQTTSVTHARGRNWSIQTVCKIVRRLPTPREKRLGTRLQVVAAQLPLL